MDYISYMRGMIGNKPMFLVGGGTLIFNELGEVLLIKRTDNNKWGIPGGSCELGETFEESAIREAYEETSLHIKNLKLFSTFSGKDMRHVYPNGDEVYNAMCIFETSDYSGNLTADEYESSDVRFFNLENLPDEVNPPDTIVLDSYIEREKTCNENRI